MADTDDPILPARERARLEHRDRKRETRMVVDNAGVKRVRRAILRRDSQPQPPASTPAEHP